MTEIKIIGELVGLLVIVVLFVINQKKQSPSQDARIMEMLSGHLSNCRSCKEKNDTLTKRIDSYAKDAYEADRRIETDLQAIKIYFNSADRNDQAISQLTTAINALASGGKKR